MGRSGAGVLICTTSYPASDPDGREAAGAFVADFASQLARTRPVTVLAPATIAGEEVDGALRVIRFAVPRTPLSLLRPGDPRHWPAIHQTLREGHRRLLALMTEEEYAHLFALWALPSGWWARSASRRQRVPYSIWALGSDIWSLGRLPLVRRLLRAVLQEASFRFADGLELSRQVEQLAGRECRFLPSSRRLGTGEPAARAAEPPYRLAFLGRWHPNKGIDLLLEALRRLPEADWNRIAELRLAGGGPLQALVHEGVRALQREGRPVSLLGFLDRKEAIALLDWADYLVIPSRIESIPVIFSDALQRGCPMVATPAGDLARLVPELGVGISAAGFGPGELCRALRLALRTPACSWHGALRRAVGRFSVAGSVDLFRRLALAEEL